MAPNFENWLKRQLKAKGRADIDRETYYEFFYPFADYTDYTLKQLKTDWPEMIQRSKQGYEMVSIVHENMDWTIHGCLQRHFYSEFNVIKHYFNEYYSMFGLYDRSYFKSIINDFRKYIPKDNRCPEISYFDDLIEEYAKEFDPGELVKTPLKFADYLNHDNPKQLIEKLKQRFPTGKNKEAAIMITALETAGLLFEIGNETDLISAIKIEWGINFKDEAYRKQRRIIRNRRMIDKKPDTAEVVKAVNFVISCK